MLIRHQQCLKYETSITIAAVIGNSTSRSWNLREKWHFLSNGSLPQSWGCLVIKLGLFYQIFQYVWIFQKMFKPLHRVEVCLSWSLESVAEMEQQHEVAIPGYSKSSLQESSSKAFKSTKIIVESFPLVVQTQSWRSQHLCRRPRSARPRWLSCRPAWRGGRWPDSPDQIR